MYNDNDHPNVSMSQSMTPMAKGKGMGPVAYPVALDHASRNVPSQYSQRLNVGCNHRVNVCEVVFLHRRLPQRKPCAHTHVSERP